MKRIRMVRLLGAMLALVLLCMPMFAMAGVCGEGNREAVSVTTEDSVPVMGEKKDMNVLCCGDHWHRFSPGGVGHIHIGQVGASQGGLGMGNPNYPQYEEKREATPILPVPSGYHTLYDGNGTGTTAYASWNATSLWVENAWLSGEYSSLENAVNGEVLVVQNMKGQVLASARIRTDAYYGRNETMTLYFTMSGMQKNQDVIVSMGDMYGSRVYAYMRTDASAAITLNNLYLSGEGLSLVGNAGYSRWISGTPFGYGSIPYDSFYTESAEYGLYIQGSSVFMGTQMTIHGDYNPYRDSAQIWVYGSMPGQPIQVYGVEITTSGVSVPKVSLGTLNAGFLQIYTGGLLGAEGSGATSAEIKF